jgi:transcriptional regulator of arginine metabolism
MTKAYRQAQIKKILRRQRVSTQNELGEALAAEGIETSQVTLSRDLRELGVVKTPEGYRSPSSVQRSATPRDTLTRVLREFLLDIEIAQHLVVMKTHPGSAGTVAEALDLEERLGIVGTIAGDNTIFAATRTVSAAKRVRDRLMKLWR